MKTKIQITTLFLACGALIFSGSDLFAQGNSQGKGNGNKQKEEKEYKSEAYKVKKDQDYKKKDEDYYKGKDNKAYKGKKDKAYKTTGNGKKYPHTKPHSFKVPPGHYPAAGYYRVWYPGRPPGQQPAPVRNGMPPNAPLTDGAFIIYGGQAYDTQYDWRQAEVQQKKSIPREVIDILFPAGVTPPAQ